MELLWKTAGAALCVCAVGLLLRQKSPELALPLSAAAVSLLLLSGLGYLQGLGELREAVRVLLGRDEPYTAPILKCVAIGLVTRFTTSLCVDASQRALGEAVELVGTACALSVSLPLVMAVLKLLGGLL